MRRPAILAAALFVACVGSVGCSSADGPTPAQGCQDFIDAWCNQNASCRAPSDRAHYRDDCEFVNGLSVDCSKAKGLGSTYDACLSDVTHSSCATYVDGQGLPFPPNCKGILIQ